MLPIVVTIVVGGVTAFLGSLAFTYAVVGRQREEDIEESRLLPYMPVHVGAICPKCGVSSGNHRGLTQPVACDIRSAMAGCKVAVSHLHVECTWCHSQWTMRTRDDVQSEEAGER